MQGLTRKENTASATHAPTEKKVQSSGITALRNLVEAGSDSLLNSEDPNQRIKGLVGIKKYIAKQLATKEISSEKAHDLLDELSMLMRSILNDTNYEVYVEALKLLKFAMNQILKLLSPFDLQITVNTIISILIPKTIASPSHKIQIASDKFIISLGKESLVGPIIIIKNIFRLIEKLTTECSNYYKSLRMSSSQHGFATQGNVNSLFDLNQNVAAVIKYIGIASVVLTHFSTAIANSKEAVEAFAEMSIVMWGVYAEKAQVKETLAQFAKDIRNIDSKVFDGVLAKKEGDDKFRLTELINASTGIAESKMQKSEAKPSKKLKSEPRKSATLEIKETTESMLPAVQPMSVQSANIHEEVKISKQLPSYAKRLGKMAENKSNQALPPIADKQHSLPPLVLRKNPEEPKKKPFGQTEERQFSVTGSGFGKIERKGSQEEADDPIKAQAMRSQPFRFPK